MLPRGSLLVASNTGGCQPKGGVMAFRDLLRYIKLPDLNDNELTDLKGVLEQELERARKSLELLNDAVPGLEEKLADLEQERQNRGRSRP